MQGALDTCARLVDEHSVTDVAAAVASLLKSGATLPLLVPYVCGAFCDAAMHLVL